MHVIYTCYGRAHSCYPLGFTHTASVKAQSSRGLTATGSARALLTPGPHAAALACVTDHSLIELNN